jgi:hypothetical protein
MDIHFFHFEALSDECDCTLGTHLVSEIVAYFDVVYQVRDVNNLILGALGLVILAHRTIILLLFTIVRGRIRERVTSLIFFVGDISYEIAHFSSCWGDQKLTNTNI